MRLLLLGFLVVLSFSYGNFREIMSLKESESDFSNNSTEEVDVQAKNSTEDELTSPSDDKVSESDDKDTSNELMKEIEISHEVLGDQEADYSDEEEMDLDYDPDYGEKLLLPDALNSYMPKSPYEMMLMNFFPRHWGNYPVHREYRHPAARRFYYPPPPSRYLKAMQQEVNSQTHKLSRRSAFESFLKKRIEVKDSDEWWMDIDGGQANSVTDWFRANMPNFGASEVLRDRMHHFAPAIHIGEISTGYEVNPHIGKPSDRSFGSHFDFNEQDLETFAYRPTSERFSSIHQLVEQVDHGTFPHGKKYILDHFITHETKCWQYEGYDMSQHALEQFPHHFWRIDCHKVYKGVYKLFGYTKVDPSNPVHPISVHHKNHKDNFVLFFRTIEKHHRDQRLFAIKHANSFGIRPESAIVNKGKVFDDSLNFNSASKGAGPVSKSNPHNIGLMIDDLIAMIVKHHPSQEQLSAIPGLIKVKDHLHALIEQKPAVLQQLAGQLKSSLSQVHQKPTVQNIDNAITQTMIHLNFDDFIDFDIDLHDSIIAPGSKVILNEVENDDGEVHIGKTEKSNIE